MNQFIQQAVESEEAMKETIRCRLIYAGVDDVNGIVTNNMYHYVQLSLSALSEAMKERVKAKRIAKYYIEKGVKHNLCDIYNQALDDVLQDLQDITK